jgi:hypothetical protein
MRLIIKIIRNVSKFLAIGILAFAPLVVIAATPFVQELPKVTTPEWLPWISCLFVLFALFIFSIPFVILSSVKKNPKEYESKRLYSPRIWYLNLGVGSSACIAIGALMMVGFIGNSFYWAYSWAGISFSMELYWFWRYFVHLRKHEL